MGISLQISGRDLRETSHMDDLGRVHAYLSAFAIPLRESPMGNHQISMDEAKKLLQESLSIPGQDGAKFKLALKIAHWMCINDAEEAFVVCS